MKCHGYREITLLTSGATTLGISSVQFISVTQSCPTLWDHMDRSTPGLTNSWSSLRLTSIESVMPSSHLILCRPPYLLPRSLPASVFSSASALRIRWPNYWSFSMSASNEYSGLISFWIDWFDLLAVQGTLKSLFQHHNSKAPIPWCSAFFMIQLSHPDVFTHY